jgi:hypothetical protein
MFRSYQVFVARVELIHFYETPILIFTASLLVVIYNYATIKLYAVLGIPLYFVAPLVSATINISEVYLVPEAVQVYEGSSNLRSWIKFLSRSKYERRKAASLRPVCINVGPFCMIDKSVQRSIFSYQIIYTVNALLFI